VVNMRDDGKVTNFILLIFLLHSESLA
jgi:hypothetical protein